MKAKPATPAGGGGLGEAGVGSRPRLRRGVRVVFDRTRGMEVVLHPEGVLVPNPTASAILGLCDGERTLQEIEVALGKQFDGVRGEQILAVLERLKDRQVVEWV